jgi:hypothetical protein
MGIGGLKAEKGPSINAATFIWKEDKNTWHIKRSEAMR